MKRLTIVRHAKSSWDSPQLSDFERPLNKRGRRDSIDMGERLLAAGFKPQAIVTSPAVRALTTAQRLAAAMGLPTDSIITERAIYEASCDALLDSLWGFDDRYDDLMLIGHNPGLSAFANALASKPIDPLVTCAVVVLRFERESWHTIIPSEGKLLHYDYPKKG